MMKKYRGVGKYDQDYDQYMHSEHYDNRSVAESLIDQAERADQTINTDPDILKHTMDMDLRDNIPPQMYSVVSGFIELIEKLERSKEDES